VDFNAGLPATVRKKRQKYHNTTENLNNVVDQPELMGIYKTTCTIKIIFKHM
jgi:hypothetical protein